MKTITIICHSFPPLNNVASGRPYSWAVYFCSLGAKVIVLTTKKEKWVGPLDYTPDLPNNLEIIEVPWILNGLEQKSKFHLKISRMLMGFALFRAYKNKFPADDSTLFISTFEPGYVHIAAYLLKKWSKNSTWHADYRDGWTTNHLDKDRKRIRNRFEKIIEKKLISKIDSLSSVSQGFLDDLLPLTHKPVPHKVIYNGFFGSEYSQLKNKSAYSSKITITYIGSRYKYQDPIPLLDALEKLNQKGLIHTNNFQLIFVGKHSDLQKIVRIKNIEHLVHFTGWIPRPQAQEIQKTSSYLLFLDWDVAETKGVLPAKIYEYMSSNARILFLGYTDSEAATIIKQTNTGIIIPNRLNGIYDFLEHQLNRSLQIFEPNVSAINFYRRSTQSERFGSFLKENKLL